MALPPTEFSELIYGMSPKEVFALLDKHQLLSPSGKGAPQDVIAFMEATLQGLQKAHEPIGEENKYAPGPTDHDLFVRALITSDYVNDEARRLARM